MYSYTYDRTTGGLLLNSTPTGISKEPRPVYAPELNILGFNKYWKYDDQTELPYMWAESNRFFYWGKHVASLKGGDIYHPPQIIIPTNEDGKLVQPEINGLPLRPIDIKAMVEANHEMIEIIESTTARKILDVYTKYKGKLDIFHIAFSGGKDSCVLLDVVKKTLPKDSFVVVFGDTGMEFPDTYDVIDYVEAQCKADNIRFYRAESHIPPIESWKIFAPPSRTIRWCCYVHKSTPQTIKLREVTGKPNFVGLDFVGVRLHESIARSEYVYENYGKKQRGQYSHYPILEWTSAEIWLYIYSQDIIINKAYKKGNSRVGCLVCPMASNSGDYMRRTNYPSEVNRFINLIKVTNDRYESKDEIETYISCGGWDGRRSGRDMKGNASKFIEHREKGTVIFEVCSPSSDWKEWIKTIDDNGVKYTVEESINGLTVSISEQFLKNDPSFGKLFRQVFRKAAYCVGCKVCEANCSNGSLTFKGSEINIERCLHCGDCHKIRGGCIRYDSIKIPLEEKPMKTINCFDDHAPLTFWMESFFENGNDFFELNTLGPNQIKCFKRFLRDASLQNKNRLTPFAELVSELGWDNDTAQGLILCNLVNNNPQFEWYVNNLDVGHIYTRETVEAMLEALEIKEKAAKSISKSFKRIVETPLGTRLHFGFADENGLSRTACTMSDNRVLLYSLYVFAEKCNIKEFTLNALLSDNIERDGISPTRMFGFDRELMIPILSGLSAKYPDFINATFTNDLDKISLKEDKSSEDVLKLF